MADSGDQLERRLHQLMANMRVLSRIGAGGQVVQQLAGLLAQQLGLGVDELPLPFDAGRRTVRECPLDTHDRPPGPKLQQVQRSPGWYSPRASRNAPRAFRWPAAARIA